MVDYRAGQVVEVTTRDVAHGGWCVARPEDGPVVFVRHAIPGETVLARITEVTSHLARAEVIEVVSPSPDRVVPPCPHAHPGGCGGCDWQHVALPAQRLLKAAVVRQQLKRLAGLDREVTVEPLPGDEEPAGPAPGSPASAGPAPAGPAPAGSAPLGRAPAAEPARGGGLGWRTRVQFAVRSDGVAGLRAHRSHDVIDVGRCLIAHPGLTDLGIEGRRWPGTVSVEGLVAPESGERAAIITPGRARTKGRPPGPRAPQDATSSIPAGRPDTPGPPDLPGADSVLRRAGPPNRGLAPLRGHAYLSQRAAGRDWRVSVGAFWQVHPAAADVLTDVVLAALAPEPGDVAVDLYCGAGLFAGSLARVVGPTGAVVGVESDAAAVRDARHNLREWPWARVHRGDVAEVLGRGGQAGALPPARLVVADPPRAGLAREVIDYLGRPETGAARFAYVSCDPATLARDIGLLVARGWTLDGLRAFDAFPMTHHVECVAALSAPRSQPSTHVHS
jgi:tRNA/tmRNA/rRNA uracil-C5-methylase (TrmA/RlmC/RlmD family)